MLRSLRAQGTDPESLWLQEPEGNGRDVRGKVGMKEEEIRNGVKGQVQQGRGRKDRSPGQAVGRSTVSITKNVDIKELRLLPGTGTPVGVGSVGETRHTEGRR